MRAGRPRSQHSPAFFTGGSGPCSQAGNAGPYGIRPDLIARLRVRPVTRESDPMKRRQFLKAAGIGVAATAIAKPAIAQTNPAIRWRLTSSFPKSLDTLYGAMETIARFVAESTDNQFQMQTFAAGEIVPGLNAMDAVNSR